VENKNNDKNKENMNNFFKEMSYELAGDIGAIDNEDMLHNSYLETDDFKNRNKINKKDK